MHTGWLVYIHCNQYTYEILLQKQSVIWKCHCLTASRTKMLDVHGLMDSTGNLHSYSMTYSLTDNFFHWRVILHKTFNNILVRFCIYCLCLPLWWNTQQPTAQTMQFQLRLHKNVESTVVGRLHHEMSYLWMMWQSRSASKKRSCIVKKVLK